jgi:predicted DNA-binding transcriptional regulator YafY
MARSAEIIRQWEILREIDGSRTGVGIARLVALTRVHPRTIRRDLQALCSAGFPLYDDKVNGSSMWKLHARPFRGLDTTGLSRIELCALYLGRAVLEANGSGAMALELEGAFGKLETAIPEPTRRFLDRLSMIARAKASGRRKHNLRKTRDILARIVDASLMRRRVEMTYDSATSRRTKRYVADPHRVTSADGGIYITAWIPDYEEMRTFALERIRTLGVLDEHFELRPLPPEPFANSLGAFTGRPELVEIEFDARIAEFVASREWHKSQTLSIGDDGSLLMRLCVSIDPPLRRWILGFGGNATVLSPRSLARDIFEDVQAARDRYMPKLRFEPLRMTLDQHQRQLPIEGSDSHVRSA